MRLLASCSLLALSASCALAHVFWLSPSSFTPRADEVLKIYAYVGDHFPGEQKQRDNARIESFQCFGPDGKPYEVMGRDGYAPVGIDRPTKPGLYIYDYRSNNASVSLATDKFDAYLAEHGMTAMIEARSTTPRPELPTATRPDVRPVHEAYSRCAKSIVTVGDAADSLFTGFDRDTGLRFEIIPTVNPVVAKVGDSLTFRLLFDGKPFQGSSVFANRPGGTRQSQRPNDAGEVTFVVDAPGMWVVDATHIAPAPLTPAISEVHPRGTSPVAKASGPVPDYQSVWSSLSFSIR